MNLAPFFDQADIPKSSDANFFPLDPATQVFLGGVGNRQVLRRPILYAPWKVLLQENLFQSHPTLPLWYNTVRMFII